MTKKQGHTPSVSDRRKQEEQRRQQAKQRNMIIAGIVIVALGAVLALSFFRGRSDGATDEFTGTEITGERPLASLDPTERADYYTSPPEMVIDTTKDFQAIFRMANGKEMRFDLFDDAASMTVNNFIYLANQGYYDGTTFHRVLADFMAQGVIQQARGAAAPAICLKTKRTMA